MEFNPSVSTQTPPIWMRSGSTDLEKGEIYLKQSYAQFSTAEYRRAKNLCDKAYVSLKSSFEQDKTEVVIDYLADTYDLRAELSSNIPEWRENYETAESYGSTTAKYTLRRLEERSDYHRENEVIQWQKSKWLMEESFALSLRKTNPTQNPKLPELTNLPRLESPLSFNSNFPYNAVAYYKVTNIPENIINTHHLVYCLSKTHKNNKALKDLAGHIINVFFETYHCKYFEHWQELMHLASIDDQEIYLNLINLTTEKFVNTKTPLDSNPQAFSSFIRMIVCCDENLLKIESVRDIIRSNLYAFIKKLAKDLNEANKDHGEDVRRIHKLVSMLSDLLDVLRNIGINLYQRKDLNNELDKILQKLIFNKDRKLATSVRYAQQALNFIPDDEIVWKLPLFWNVETKNILFFITSLAPSISQMGYLSTYIFPTLIASLPNDDFYRKNGEEILEKKKEFAYYFLESLKTLLAEANWEFFSFDLWTRSDIKKRWKIINKDDEIIEPMKTGKKSIPLALKEIHPETWYWALRNDVDSCLEQGQFIELESFLDKQPHCFHPDFLQILCERLERAIHAYSDRDIKEDVLYLLRKISQRVADWNPPAYQIVNESLEHLSKESTEKPDIRPHWDRAWLAPPENALLRDALNNPRYQNGSSTIGHLA